MICRPSHCCRRGAEALLAHPRNSAASPKAETSAGLLAASLRADTDDALALDSLTFAPVGQVFGNDDVRAGAARRGGLTDRQLARVDRLHQRLTVADMGGRGALGKPVRSSRPAEHRDPAAKGVPDRPDRTAKTRLAGSF